MGNSSNEITDAAVDAVVQSGNTGDVTVDQHTTTVQVNNGDGTTYINGDMNGPLGHTFNR
ncbi:hypothetical protein [Streptomyces sp. CC224B]|uniref:hypothetical protein n=1 Tax=Streptomyces sp. CC224B TaxID=3044571 RepID=UPI0024A7F38E|nr:hypothetical protein [Streptomyces sp. CC224B]